MAEKHWTESSVEDFQFAVSFQFVDQIQEALKASALSQKDLAAALGVSPGRISQVVNDPGNLTLKLMIAWARAIGHKVGVVVYDDDDGERTRGPIDANLFRACWEKLGRPRDFGEFPSEDGYESTLAAPEHEATEDCKVIKLSEWCRAKAVSEDTLLVAGAIN